MTAIAVALTPDFADWECALLMAVARSYLGVTVKTATADGRPVMSMGGPTVMPDHSYGDIGPEAFDALVVPGGLSWENGTVPADLEGLIQRFHGASRLVAGICAAASMLAGAGALNQARHTGNSVQSHQAYPAYRGSALFVDGPRAVSSDGVVTAAGTAPVTFSIEILKSLGLWSATAQEELAPFSAEHR